MNMVKTDMNKKYYVLYIILISVFVLFPVRGYAQYGIGDKLSIESMVSNHKKLRSLLETRVVLELTTDSLHKYRMKKTQDYKKEKERFDRYKRNFEYVDAILSGAATAFHGIRTYNACKNDLTDYVNLLDKFRCNVLDLQAKKIKIVASDTLILNASETLITSLRRDTKNLYSSFIDLSTYMTGASECSASNLMLILDNINTSLSTMQQNIHRAYMQLWTYMTLRFGYYKKGVFTTSKTVKQICDSAYSKWKGAQYEVFKVLSNKSSLTHKSLGGGSLIGGRH